MTPHIHRRPHRQPADAGSGGGKSADAFRTISEVSDEIDVPQHVLRFWETKFPQVSPLKRGGGRRYYQPDDIKLLRRIRHWLYVEGYTIRGVQRLLKEGAGKGTAAAKGGKTGAGGAPAGSGDPVEDLRDLLDELEGLRAELRRRLS